MSNFWSYKQIQEETNIPSESDDEDSEYESNYLGSATISRYFSAFRDMIGAEMLENYGEKIGGMGLTVEIDESMFGKV